MMNMDKNVSKNDCGKTKMNREEIGCAAEKIISEINEKRKVTDSLMMAKIREKLNNQVEHIMKDIEDKLYKTYETNSAETQLKVDSLWGVLHNIEQLECEISDFKMALEGFCRDVVQPSNI